MIGVVAFVLVSLYGLRQTTNTLNTAISPSINPPINSAIKAVADTYVISLVGEAEFNKNYQLDYDKTEKCDDERITGGYGCYIRYTFLPGEKYGESVYLFYYKPAENKVAIANNGIPLTLPSCENDTNKCNFKISLNELKDIARRENVSDTYFQLIQYNGQIVAEASFCDLNTLDNRNKVYIDLLNGEILWRGPNSECQGIF